MVFYWSFSDSKSPRVSRTLLNILANDLVWMVLASCFPAPFSAWTVTTGITSFLNSLARFKYLFLFLLSLIFTLWSTGTSESSIRQVLFYVNYHQVWSTDRNIVIFLYFKVPVNFMRLNLLDGLFFYAYTIW